MRDIISISKYYKKGSGYINTNINNRLGEENINKQGLHMKIIKYENSHNISVKFDDGTILEHVYYYNFKNGITINPNCKERLYEEAYNVDGDLMKIIEYKNSTNIIVEFQDEFKFHKKSSYSNFKNGNIRNPYHKTICNVGYIGEILNTGNIKKLKSYKVWRDMIIRCYSTNENIRKKFRSYDDCIVCDEWHNFTNFNKWYENNYYCIKDEVMEIDKDILNKGNKIYSPETCCIVPSLINQTLEMAKYHRGNSPIGVSYHKSTGLYSSNCNVCGKQKYLGEYKTEIEAFNVYKNFKEKHIKYLAELYKDYLPEKIYVALYNWKVEITD